MFTALRNSSAACNAAPGLRTCIMRMALVTVMLGAAAHSPPIADEIQTEFSYFGFPICYAGDSRVEMFYAKFNSTAYNSSPWGRMFKEYTICAPMPPFADRATYVYPLSRSYQYCCYYPPKEWEVVGTYSRGRYWSIGEGRDCYGHSDCSCHPDLFFAHSWSCGYFGDKCPKESISYGGPNDGQYCSLVRYIVL